MAEAKHPQVHAQLNYEYFAVVDAELQYLLLSLWSLGIRTHYSCQGESFFKDETLFANRRHRAYVLLERTEKSLLFVSDLLKNFKPLYADRTLWDIELFNREVDDRPQICLRFPNSDIEVFTEYVETLVLAQEPI